MIFGTYTNATRKNILKTDDIYPDPAYIS